MPSACGDNASGGDENYAARAGAHGADAHDAHDAHAPRGGVRVKKNP